jgi:hypothetical protein
MLFLIFLCNPPPHPCLICCLSPILFMNTSSYNATPYQTSCFLSLILCEVHIFSAVSCVKSHQSNFVSQPYRQEIKWRGLCTLIYKFSDSKEEGQADTGINGLHVVGDCTETCRSCFNVNFKVNFKIVFKTIQLYFSW